MVLRSNDERISLTQGALGRERLGRGEGGREKSGDDFHSLEKNTGSEGEVEHEGCKKRQRKRETGGFDGGEPFGTASEKGSGEQKKESKIEDGRWTRPMITGLYASEEPWVNGMRERWVEMESWEAGEVKGVQRE